MRSRTGKALTAVALGGAFLLVGFTAVSLGVSSDGGTPGQASQTAVGAQSANSVRGLTGTGDGTTPTGNSLPGSGAGSGSPSGTAGTAGSGSGSKSLPFTGLLAIPVLLTGAGLLGAGLVARRRGPARVTA